MFKSSDLSGRHEKEIEKLLNKVFYLNKTKEKGYFLLNTYQKPNVLNDLEIGNEWKIRLVNGLKQRFFECFV